jgi:uncharacterized membrane protein (UPF0127 family)
MTLKISAAMNNLRWREKIGNGASPKIKPWRRQGRGRARAVSLVAAVVTLVATASNVACDEQPKVLIETPKGTVAIPVEIADTPEKRTRGLMYRRDLPSNAGMLFVFPRSEVLQFWMKNTPLSLDMIFFDRERRIVGIVERAQPFSTRAVGPDVPAQYVLEVHGGFAVQHGIAVGQSATFVRVPPARD